MVKLFRLAACALQPEDVTNSSRRGNHQSEFRRVGCGAKTDYRLVAAGEVGLFPAGRIEDAKVCFAFLGIDRDDAAAVSPPDWWCIAAAAWRGVVTTHS